MKHLFLNIFIFLFLTGSSQNLVINPSFEQFVTCPNITDTFAKWGVNGWWGFDYSDVFYGNSCANSTPGYGQVGMPINSYGYQQARTGNAYTLLLVLSWPHTRMNIRQYLQGTFRKPLIKDSLYCVSYWVSLDNYASRAIQNVDAYINKNVLNWPHISGSLLGTDTVLININPQIKSDRILKDTLNWMEVKGFYRAMGGEKYITIGNFENDANTLVQNLGTNDDGAALPYFLDDISVIPFSLKAPALGNDTLLCAAQLPLSLKAPIGYDSLRWSTGETSAAISASQPGKYWLRCTANGCGSLTDTLVIKTYSVPTLRLRNDTLLCKGSVMNLNGTPGFSAYQWSNGSTNPTITVNKAGIYKLNVQDQCGSQTDSVHITYDSLPDYRITLGDDFSICTNGINEPYTLMSNYTDLPDYSWNTGERTSEITVKAQGDYFFKSKFYCGTLFSDTVFVQECLADTTITMYIPNAFTPNGSGLNDTWQPVFLNQHISELYIYDRWGNKLFTGTEKNNYSWDGTFKGILCDQGIYAYKIIYTSSLPEKPHTTYQKTGMICLLN